MVLAVDHIRRDGQPVEIVDHGDRGLPDLRGDLAQIGAVSDRRVATREKPQGHVAHVKLRAGQPSEGVIRDQDPEGHLIVVLHD